MTSTRQPRPEARSADQRPERPSPPQPAVVAGGSLAALALRGTVRTVSGGITALLIVVGLALGVALFHARFGFTSARRQLVAVRQGAGLRAP